MIFEQPVNIYSQDYVLKRFQSNETAVQVVRGKISALISESELIELQNSKATMYSKLASAVLDINSLQLQFSDISSKYDTVTGQYSSLDAKVADYKAGLDGLSVNLTNLSTRINNDYSTTTAMNAAIKASVDGLSSTVSQTYATTQNVKSSLAEADTNAKKYADTAQSIVGAAVAVLSYIFGEHWILFALFLAFNVADWITGWMKARLTHKENSKAGWKGVLKKLAYWIMIAVAFGASAVFVEIGKTLGVDLGITTLLGFFVLASLLVNEIRSICENLVEMGVDVPKILIKGLEVADKAINKDGEDIDEGE